VVGGQGYREDWVWVTGWAKQEALRIWHGSTLPATQGCTSAAPAAGGHRVTSAFEKTFHKQGHTPGHKDLTGHKNGGGIFVFASGRISPDSG
jgi:hypothetical protein